MLALQTGMISLATMNISGAQSISSPKDRINASFPIISWCFRKAITGCILRPFEPCSSQPSPFPTFPRSWRGWHLTLCSNLRSRPRLPSQRPCRRRGWMIALFRRSFKWWRRFWAPLWRSSLRWSWWSGLLFWRLLWASKHQLERRWPILRRITNFDTVSDFLSHYSDWFSVWFMICMIQYILRTLLDSMANFLSDYKSKQEVSTNPERIRSNMNWEIPCLIPRPIFWATIRGLSVLT